jgi:hypothetical protein
MTLSDEPPKPLLVDRLGGLLSTIAAYVAPLRENDEDFDIVLAKPVEVLPIGIRGIVRIARRVMAEGITNTAWLVIIDAMPLETRLVQLGIPCPFYKI